MAWSDGARKYWRRTGLLMPGCTPGLAHPAKNCANCLPYALRWRKHVLGVHSITYAQLDLFVDGEVQL